MWYVVIMIYFTINIILAKKCYELTGNIIKEILTVFFGLYVFIYLYILAFYKTFKKL